MGKSNNIFGAISGKIGGTIFYRRKNSKYNQGTRAYIADVKNPKSMGQARQRMTMKAVQNLYSALAEVINRAYQSTAYGNPSRIKFLGNAMKNFQGPWLEKGSSAVIPFAVNLAEGTLGRVSVEKVGGRLRTSIPLASTGEYGTVNLVNAFENGSVGEISKGLLNAADIIKVGDQLTIVAFDNQVEGAEPVPVVFSFIVDPNSVETIQLGWLNFGGEEPERLDITGNNTCAAAAIISREGLSGQHMRSTSALFVDTTATSIAQFFSDAQYQQAILSYMDASTSSDWPVEPEDDENIVKSLVTVQMPSANLTFHPVAGGAAIVPAQAMDVQLIGYRTPGGSLGLFEEDGTQNLYGVYTGPYFKQVKKVTIDNGGQSVECYVRLNTANPGEVRFITIV